MEVDIADNNYDDDQRMKSLERDYLDFLDDQVFTFFKCLCTTFIKIIIFKN